MSVNDPPIIRWYVATAIYRCTINGQDGNPFHGEDRSIPAIHRDVMLLQSHSPDAAYELAVERARDNQDSKIPCGEKGAWEFAGLEDLEELRNRNSLDGALVWSRCVMGVPASSLVHPKEEMSVFDSWRGWTISPADNHR